jgi:hypothetical protein
MLSRDVMKKTRTGDGVGEFLFSALRQEQATHERSAAPIGGLGIRRKTPGGFLSAHSLPVLRLRIMEVKYWISKVFKSFRKGENEMTHKRRTIQLQKSTISDLMSHLAGLPEREKGSDDLVNLPEIFRTKEYMAEIRGALKKGYTFEDLAGIFTKRCGVIVTARQLKYHFTRGKNRGLKNQVGKKVEVIEAQEERALSKNPPRKNSDSSTEKNVEVSMKGSSKSSAIVLDNRLTAKVKPGSFLINMESEEI